MSVGRFKTLSPYVDCIKNDHLAGVSDPLRIFHRLIQLYLERDSGRVSIITAPDISLFSHPPHPVRADLRWLDDVLTASTETLDLYPIMLEIEIQTKDYATPWPVELEAMLISFFKYYSSVLPQPEPNSKFEMISTRAKHCLIKERMAELQISFERAQDLTLGEKERYDYYRNIRNLKQTDADTDKLFLSLLNNMLIEGKSHWLENFTYSCIFELTVDISIWVKSLSLVISKIKTLDKLGDGDEYCYYLTLIDYLCLMLDKFSRDNISIQVSLQEELVDALIATLSNIGIYRLLGTLTTSIIIDEKVKKRIFEEVRKKINDDLKNKFDCYLDFFKIQHSLSEELSLILDDLFEYVKKIESDEVEKEKWKKDPYNHRKPLSYLANFLHAMSESQLSDAYIIKVLKYSFSKNLADYSASHYYPLLEFIEKTAIPPSMEAEVISYLCSIAKSRHQNSMDAIKTLVHVLGKREHTKEIIDLIRDVICEHLDSLITEFDSGHRFDSSGIHYIINHNILLARHKKDLREKLFSLAFSLDYVEYEKRSKSIELLILLSPIEERKILLSVCLKWLESNNEHYIKIALNNLTELTEIEDTVRFNIIDCVLNIHFTATNNYYHDYHTSVLMPLRKLAKSQDEKEMIFKKYLSFLSHDSKKVRDWYLYHLTQMNLSKQQKDKLTDYIYQQLESFINTGSEGDFKIEELIRCLGKIVISDEKKSRFISLYKVLLDWIPSLENIPSWAVDSIYKKLPFMVVNEYQVSDLFTSLRKKINTIHHHTGLESYINCLIELNKIHLLPWTFDEVRDLFYKFVEIYVKAELGMRRLIAQHFLTLLHTLPANFKIAMLTYVETLPLDLSVSFREKIRVRLDYEESQRASHLPPEMWREVYKH